MAWFRKKQKRELWMFPLLTNGEPGQLIEKARLTLVLKALASRDGNTVKKVSDGDLWMKAVFTHEAVDECFQGDSQEEDWDRCLILLKKYKVEHNVNDQGTLEFVLKVVEFSFWTNQSGFNLKTEPLFCMDVPEIRRKSDAIQRETLRDAAAEQVTPDSLGLSDLLGQMTQPDNSQTAVAPKTPSKSDNTVHQSPGHNLPDSPPQLDPFALLNDSINSQERRELDAIEEWKPDYVPPRMRDSTNEDSPESCVPAAAGSSAKSDLMNVQNSPQRARSVSPKTVSKKRVLDSVVDSSEESIAPRSKVRKLDAELCNGDVDMGDEKQKPLRETEVEQSGKRQSTLKNDSEQSDSVSDGKSSDKDRNSNDLTPNVETQGQRIPSSDSNNSSSKPSNSSSTPAAAPTSEPIQTEESDAADMGSILLSTQMRPPTQIDDYQQEAELSCEAKDKDEEQQAVAKKGDEHPVSSAISPVRHQSTQQASDDSQIPRPDFPMSPVPVVGESQDAEMVTDSNEASNKGEGKEAPMSPTRDEGLCVGSYFSTGFSPPLVMPSTSHLPPGPVSPSDPHTPLHPPARPSTSTYTPLMKKGSARKLSPTRKPPSPTRKTPSKSVVLPNQPDASKSNKTTARTPMNKERRESLLEEQRLAVLSGRKQLRKSIEDELRKTGEDDDDAQSMSSVGTVPVASSSQDEDFDPVAVEMDEQERESAEFREATNKLEVVDVKLVKSPLKKCPTLSVTAFSPGKKRSKSVSSLKSRDSNSGTSCASSKSAKELKTFSLGKNSNKFEVNLTILEGNIKRSTPAVPVSSKRKTPLKKKADISVLFASPDKLRKSVSEPTPVSRKPASLVKKRRKIKLYNQSMLMPVDETPGSLESSPMTDSVQSTPDSDLLISNSSNETDSQRTASGRVRQRANSNDTTSVSSEDLVTPMNREERHAHKNKFLEKSQKTLTPNTAHKLISSPLVPLSGMDVTPSLSLTAAQRSWHGENTAVGAREEEQETQAFSPVEVDVTSSGSRFTDSGRSAGSPPEDPVSLLQRIQLEENKVSERQKELFNIPVSNHLSAILDRYLTLPKFGPS